MSRWAAERSAKSAGQLFDLRCAVREHVVGLLREMDGGRYLPRRRIEPGRDASARHAADGEDERQGRFA